MKIAVAGVGYVGLANATLLSQKHEVIAYDINEDKVNKINKRLYMMIILKIFLKILILI